MKRLWFGFLMAALAANSCNGYEGTGGQDATFTTDAQSDSSADQTLLDTQSDAAVDQTPDNGQTDPLIDVTVDQGDMAMPTESEWITLETTGLGMVDALYRHPSPAAMLPAVVYNHGAIIESTGYEEGAAQGYDVDEFVAAIADAGFVALAPIRPPTTLETNDVTPVAIAYLDRLENVDHDRIYVIGFSKGGLLSLHGVVQADSARPTALVLMSPALGSSWNSEEEMDTYLSSVDIDLSVIDFPVFITLGDEDSEAFVNNVTNYLIPRLETLGVDVEYQLDYPGDHQSFWVVRDDHFPDVIDFFNRHP